MKGWLPRVSSIRVLVVEDNEPFQRFICSMLETSPELQVIGKVSDGLDAVQRAQELQPDLIVLDIGLPTLSGLEAARRIRKLSPQSKIIFLTQESSADVVEEALNLGAKGFVLKANAGSELLAAVEAVRQGGEFVSSGLSGRNSTDLADKQVSGRLCHQEDLPSPASRTRHFLRGHVVGFYGDDASFLVGFTCFLETALEAGNAVIVIATESHRQAFLQGLQAHGVDVAAAIEQRRYIPLDVAETLSTFMVNEVPDPVRFQKTVGDLFAAAAKGAKGEHRCVSACGEGAPTLWTEGKGDAAIQIEHLWDEMAREYDVDTLCGYVLSDFQREQEGSIYERICAEHSAVYSQ
jgi:DNA-binding NarL/FixJ family response regulator